MSFTHNRCRRLCYCFKINRNINKIANGYELRRKTLCSNVCAYCPKSRKVSSNNACCTINFQKKQVYSALFCISHASISQSINQSHRLSHIFFIIFFTESHSEADVLFVISRFRKSKGRMLLDSDYAVKNDFFANSSATKWILFKMWDVFMHNCTFQITYCLSLLHNDVWWISICFNQSINQLIFISTTNKFIK